MAAEQPPRGAVLRLWRVYAHLDFLWVTRGLGNFLLYTVADMVGAVASVAGTWLLAQRFGGIGSWSREQVLFLLGYAIAARGIPDLLTNYNVLHLSRRIGRGQLDHVLIQPRPIWLTLLTEGFVPWSGALYALPGLVILAAAAGRVAPPGWPIWAAALALNLAASSALLVAYSVLWAGLAFPYPQAAEEISSRAVDIVTDLKGFPLERVGAGMLGALTTVVPVAFAAWLPCRSLAGVEPSAMGMLVTPAAAAVFCVAAAWTFKTGLAHYMRSGSQRYVANGHRR